MLGTEITEGADRDVRHLCYFQSCWKNVLFIDIRSVPPTLAGKSVVASKMAARNKLYTYKVNLGTLHTSIITFE